MSRPVLSLKPKLASVARATPSPRPDPQEAPKALGETIPPSPRLERTDHLAGNSPLSPTAVIDWLTHTYPGLFNRSDFKPLKIGILADLLPAIREAGFSKRLAKRALGFWTSRIAYQRALALGGPRYDL
jgi:hypothetical protein